MATTQKVHVSVANIEKSLFPVKHHVPTTFQFGKLVPVNFMEVMANGTYKINLASSIEMSTPIKPIKSNIWLDVYPIFIPYRLLLRGDYGFGQKSGSYEELFTGHNEDTSWITQQSIPDIVPTDGANLINDFAGEHDAIGNYLFLAPIKASDQPVAANYNVSPLIGRGYYLAWNELFRVEKVSTPYDISYENDGYVLNGENYRGEAYKDPLLPVAKRPDYFINCLPAPLPHGEVVSISLGSLAPVSALDLTHTTPAVGVKNSVIPNMNQAAGVNIRNVGVAGNNLASGADLPTGVSAGDAVLGAGSSANSNGIIFDPNNLWADLTNVTAVTLDALREAVALQHLLQNDARGGLRFFEELYSHFGIAPESEVIQRPQVLGHRKIYINVNRVLSNAGAADDSSSKLGQVGAVSVTSDNCQLFTYTATEPGIIYFFVTSHHDQIYANGNHPAYYRFNRLDFPWPEFGHVSAQKVPTRLIDAIHASYNDVLGYQDYADEFRFVPDRVTGLLNPHADNALDYWTLAQDFSSKPLLNAGLIYENHAPLSRALVTGDNGPDFIADFYFYGTQILPLPAFGDPGLRVL